MKDHCQLRKLNDMGKIRKRQLIVVEWDDISNYSGWQDEKESHKWTPLRCVSVGWKLKSDRKNLKIAATRSETDQCSDRSVIPKSVIRSIRRIE